MEFEKNTANFSFGAGTIKTAGAGKLSDSEPLPKTALDKKKIAKTATLAAVSAVAILLKKKLSHK